MSKWRFKTINLEGIPGSGKTSFSRELALALGPGTLYLTEPDEKTSERPFVVGPDGEARAVAPGPDGEEPEAANPYLSDYYADKPRWAFAMQIHLLQARFGMHQHAQWHAINGGGHSVMDRSAHGDVSFADVQKELGYMEAREYKTYQQAFYKMIGFMYYPNVCVHLLTSPEVSKQRIETRMLEEEGRKCEVEISLDYLKSLDAAIMRMTDVLQHYGTLVLRIPWDDDRSTKASRVEEVTRVADIIAGHVTPREFADLYGRSM